MQDHHRTLFKGMFGVASGASAEVIHHLQALDPIIQTIGVWAGTLAAILTVVSFCFDIRKKWKHRNTAFFSREK